MYPEFLSADVTFGVCKEQRNLFRFCGVDGDLKVFQAMNCFMPSKKFQMFDWAINVAFPRLIGQNILPYNSIITTDQEMAMAEPIRRLVNDDLNQMQKERPTRSTNTAINSCHRFDMYHIFTKEWRNSVSMYFICGLK